jgi:hypothetical protein
MFDASCAPRRKWTSRAWAPTLAPMLGRLVPAILAALVSLVVFAPRAHAQFEHLLIRRLVVFPLKVEPGQESVADEAWWQAREELTKSRRFLVASKQFLVKSDVFQPRGDLEPADAIILGKLLDAHALVTLQVVGRKLTQTVYDGGNGIVLFRKTISLHPSLSISDQLAALSRKIANDFVATIPYQGYTSVDSLVGHAVFQDGDAKLAHVDLGITSGAQIGDVVQWIRMTSLNTTPLFQGGAKTTVFAEGKIVKIEEGNATVEILRATSLRDIKEFALVRVPREAERMAQEYAITDTPRTTLTAELVAPEAAPMDQVSKERRPLLTTLSFVGSIAAFLLLAF